MTSQALATFLTYAHLDATHPIIFTNFSAESLHDCVQDCSSHVAITSDEGRKGSKTITTKMIVDAALKDCPKVEHVLILKRTGNQVPWTAGRDKWWYGEVEKVPNYCPPEVMASEEPLFILYVSGAYGYFYICYILTHADFWVDR
jgi:acetyl-CoA synthetase